MKPELLERHASLVEQTKETQIEREIRAMEAALGLDTYINRMIEAGAQALTPQQIQREVGWGGYQNIGPHLSLADDYMSGQCKPWYQNEMDLQEIRGIGRWLAGSDETATCVLRNIKHYTIGEGFTISATSRDGMGAEQLAMQVQAFIDEFMEANDFTDDGESETLASAIIDGEVLLWLSFRGYDPPKIRFVGGEQITEPGDARAIEDYLGMPGLCWKFGVATDQGNCENVHGYFVDWFGRGTSWDFIPESESVFIKRNVPRLCKRGISDFYVPFKRLDRGSKLFDSAVLGATIQASIAYIKEHAAGTPEASLTSALNNRLTQQVNVMRGDGQIESVTGENHFGGKVINVAGTKYHAGPMGTPQGPTYMEIYQAVTRRVGSRWCMPEYMISSDASNSNYASTLVAESPFILAIKDEQGALGRKIKQLIWKAIQMVANAGRFPMPAFEMQGLIEIKVEAPSPESRDPVKEEQVRDSQQNAGILSKKTRATQSGLDYEQEQANIASEPQQAAPMMPGQPQAAIPGQAQQLALPNYPGTEGEERTAFLAAKAISVLLESCGANAPGGGGFQPGNDCARGGGGGSAGKQYVNKSPKTAAEISGKVPQENGKAVSVRSYTGYHVTKRENLDAILQNGFDLSKATPTWQNDYAVSMTKSANAAKKWFTPNVKGAQLDMKKYAVLEVKFKGRAFDPDDHRGFSSVSNTPQSYTRNVIRSGYDVTGGGSVMYLYNPKAIASIREVE